jgi:hypothetical protein
MLASLGAAAVVAGSVLSAPSSYGAPPDPFSGERNVVLAPSGSEGVLGLDRSLAATYAEGQGRRSQFVLTPLSASRFWIQTAHVTRGGEPQCLQLRGSSVSATACDSSKANQQFAFRRASPSNGKPTWTVRVRVDRFLVQDPDGGFSATRITEGTPDIDTPFLLVDKGPASLPTLD